MKQELETAYVDIYRNHTWPIQTFNFDHHWKTVSEPAGWEQRIRLVRYFDAQEFLPEKDYMHYFMYENPVCFMFPMTFMGVLTGFGFRSVESHEFSIRKWGPTICYTSARTLSVTDSFKYQYPIVISEGVADAEAVSQVYPWSMAALGNCVRRMVAKMLPLVTNKVYIMLDNDEGGSIGKSKIKNVLGGLVDFDFIDYPREYKDPAEYFVSDREGMKERLSFLGQQ